MIRDKVVNLLRDNISEIRKYKILKLSIFGSVARDQDSPHSDIDILIKFECPATFDLYIDLKFYLENLLGRKVDLVTEDAVRNEIREYIEKDLIRVA